MKIHASEIRIGQRLIKGYQSFRIIDNIKETQKTITFLMRHYKNNHRCLGDFDEKEITFRKTTIVETREDFVGTKFNQLHRIKTERLNSVIERGFKLYQVKEKQCYSWGDDGLEVDDYVFAKFNGINYVTETILDDVTINSIPPSPNSDKAQLSGWSNKNGGFEDYYKKVDMYIILKEIQKNISQWEEKKH